MARPFHPWLVLSGFLSTLAMASPVAAAEAAGALPPWLDEAVMLAIKLLAPVAIVLAGWAATQLARKLGAEETEIWEKRGRLLAKEALNYADRWAKTITTAVGENNKPSSNDKMEAALRYILEIQGEKAAGKNQIRALIESELEAEAKLRGET